MTDLVTTIQDGSASLVIDARYFPVTIYIWRSATMRLADAYFRARESFDARARAENTKIILVSDLTDFGVPPAKVRRAIADHAATIDKSDAMHAYVCVVPNAVIRGVITAMVWFIGEKTRPNTNVASMPEALRFAVSEYERLGVTSPAIDPDAYTASAIAVGHVG